MCLTALRRWGGESRGHGAADADANTGAGGGGGGGRAVGGAGGCEDPVRGIEGVSVCFLKGGLTGLLDWPGQQLQVIVIIFLIKAAENKESKNETRGVTRL